MIQAAAVSPVVRKSRQASPERWQRALQRALFAGVAAKQLAGSGAWIVASASRPGVAYETDGIACTCEAAMLGGDPVCLHRAAFWHAQGVLDLDDPEPPPPALGAIACFACHGRWQRRGRTGSALPCHVCGGIGSADLVAQAAALVAAAGVETCDFCGGALDDDAQTDAALQRVCGACVEASLAEALIARQDAMRTALAA
jgi:hypothetical protein